MQRRGELQIQLGIVLGHGVVAVRLLAHLDVGDGIAPALQVFQFRDRILGRRIDHRDRNHRRQPRVIPLVKKRSKPTCSPAFSSRSPTLVPGVDGGAIGRGLVLVRCMPDEVVEARHRC